jgi:hypothetical protein
MKDNSQECRIWLRLALKPLAVLATLTLFLWLGAWFDTRIANHIAHAAPVALPDPVCPVGMEQNGGLCYTPARKASLTRRGQCWRQCGAGGAGSHPYRDGRDADYA